MNARVLILTLSICSAGAFADEAPARLRVHLPRAMAVSGPTLALGEIAVCQGPDAAKAVAILMGRAPWAKERLVISRELVLSRLASCGFEGADVRVTGAKAVAVTLDARTVSSSAVADAAVELLKTARPAGPDRAWVAQDAPEMQVANGADVRLRAKLVESAQPGQPASESAVVEVLAVCGEKQLGAVKVTFALGYAIPQAVALTDIPAQAVISAANAELRQATSLRKPASAWLSPFGMIASGAIARGEVIRPGTLRPKTLTVLVHRNKPAVMKIEAPGFTITSVGVVLQDGRCGDLVKVRNVDTQRVVTARVSADGTVEPVYEESRR